MRGIIYKLLGYVVIIVGSILTLVSELLTLTLYYIEDSRAMWWKRGENLIKNAKKLRKIRKKSRLL